MNILITGANRGIGKAMADQYRAAGHTVIATARDGSADATLDVTKPADFAALVETLKGIRIDLLICNAGVYLDKGQPLETGYPVDMWADTFAANVTGVFLTVQHLLPVVVKGSGKIAIISSQMASQEIAPGGSYIYRASKAAVLNLGRNLAQDLKADGIAVGIYHPGWVKTDMGGEAAQVTVADAASGLVDRFDALSMQTTGCFETYEGRAHPF